MADFFSPAAFSTVAVTSASPVCPCATSVTRLFVCLSLPSACCTFTTASLELVQVTPLPANPSATSALTSTVPSSSKFALSWESTTPTALETSSTVTVAFAVMDGLSATVTVTSAAPSDTPSSLPSSSTFTTASLELAHVSLVCVESAGSTLASRLPVWPGASVSLSLDSFTPVAGTGLTTTSMSSLMFEP